VDCTDFNSKTLNENLGKTSLIRKSKFNILSDLLHKFH
jgi:hypothetical protein